MVNRSRISEVKCGRKMVKSPTPRTFSDSPPSRVSTRPPRSSTSWCTSARPSVYTRCASPTRRAYCAIAALDSREDSVFISLRSGATMIPPGKWLPLLSAPVTTSPVCLRAPTRPPTHIGFPHHLLSDNADRLRRDVPDQEIPRPWPDRTDPNHREGRGGRQSFAGLQ